MIVRIALALCTLFLVTACGSSPSGSSASNPAANTSAKPPPPALPDHPPCVLSADCPAGQHCDLAQCTQDCSATDPCTGNLTCSPRARCIPPSQPDTDPTPTTRYAGSFDVTPKDIRLRDRDTSFDLHLTAKSTGTVRYRVETHGPHLSIDTPRGEFSEATTLRIHVDSSSLHGRDVAGTVKIFTTLGDAVVNAPIHVGLTGTYRGSLRYANSKLTLGETRVALDILERNGDVSVRVDSRASLLFPATAEGETTGRGQFTESGLDVTLAQVVDPAFGAGRNHFRRPVGRLVRIQAKPNANGDLVGAFTDTITGLFPTPIAITGDVNLAFVPTGTDPQFNVAPDLTMPASPSKWTWWSPKDVFGWTTSDCRTIVCGCDVAGCNPCNATDVLAAFGDETVFSRPLYTAFANRGQTTPIDDIATSCKASLGATSIATWKGAARSCGLVPPLACGMLLRAQQTTTSDLTVGQHMSKMVGELLAPSLLVAKNEVVVALADSFARGAAAEATHYDTAMAALGPSAAWVMQPGILEYLRNLSPQAAKGLEPAAGDTSTQSDTYPAARALADLLYTESSIDGERARLAAAASSGAQPELAALAQGRAVLTFLETMTLAELVRTWGTVPDSVAVRYTGVLTPLNQGFVALEQGASAFGVPPNFVPFVYRAEDVGKGATNFEQMLAIVTDTVATEKNLEAQFLADKRTYEANQQELQNQLTGVRTTMDLQLHALCGAAFDPNTITSPDDWNHCGDQGGSVGELGIEIGIAKAKVTSSQSRIQGQRDKITIDTNALAEKQQLRAADISFISSQGDSLATLDFIDGVLNATQASIQVAANAQLLNFGAPLAEAAPVFAIGLIKATIDVQKQQLQTAMSVHAAQTSAQIEIVDGMANIQKEMIELTQLAIDILQDQLGVLDAQVKQLNQVAQAKSIYEERQRQLAIANKSPANDPSYRLMRDQLGLQLLSARADAQRALYLVLRALEYELNMSIAAIDGAVLNASNAVGLDALRSCAQGIFGNSRIAYGSPQDYVTVVSVRQMLGITGPRTDAVTEQTLTAGEQFRQLLLRNDNLDGRGGVGVTFATDLQPGNKLWATDVCADRIATVQAQLVGDFLGDNQAQVNLSLTGGSVMRACDSDALVTWSVSTSSNSGAEAFAVLQAGVNTYGDAPSNSSLFGQSVARASWKLLIPGAADAPTNADVDLSHVDDIVLKFDHKALARRSSPLAIDVSCLAQIGGGQ